MVPGPGAPHCAFSGDIVEACCRWPRKRTMNIQKSLIQMNHQLLWSSAIHRNQTRH